MNVAGNNPPIFVEGAPSSSNAKKSTASKDDLYGTRPPLKSPTPYEYYGFALYLGSFVTFVIYFCYAFLPESFLHQMGIRYFPSRYWAMAIPVWNMMLIFFILVAFTAYNLMNTPPLDSLNTITDDYALIIPSLPSHLPRPTRGTNDSVPEIQDIPIFVVNACLYHQCPPPGNVDDAPFMRRDATNATNKRVGWFSDF